MYDHNNFIFRCTVPFREISFCKPGNIVFEQYHKFNSKTKNATKIFCSEHRAPQMFRAKFYDAIANVTCVQVIGYR